jgi:HPt (histidine-containing phosphotransfer) domain-containing protein
LNEDPAFDENALPRLERMVGAEVLGEVLDLYLAHAPKRVEAVRAGLRTQDPASAARALHDLKSSAAMVGAADVSRLAEEMERMARQDEIAALHARLERLEDAVARADGLLREAMRRRDT